MHKCVFNFLLVLLNTTEQAALFYTSNIPKKYKRSVWFREGRYGAEDLNSSQLSMFFDDTPPPFRADLQVDSVYQRNAPVAMLSPISHHPVLPTSLGSPTPERARNTGVSDSRQVRPDRKDLVCKTVFLSFTTQARLICWPGAPGPYAGR